ncbi:hypothetical protein KOR42_53810 [Thalassoglobus neptunius]|uniref:Uncharacterized protein n=1 Tax=Thalassoglobus neptunius TaxID=1938619 RepID=A0A5C5V482_9PLAN|nr:hypothetical protein KOR42_53810 [Thalassoglobus neptunius]
MLYGQPVDSNLTDLTYRGGKSLGLSDSSARLTAGVVDSMVGAVGSGGSGLVSSPSKVATRVTANDSVRLISQGVNQGATSTLVVPNYLRPQVFPGASSGAARAMGRAQDISDNVRSMAQKYPSDFAHKCGELEALTQAERAAYNISNLPGGSATATRTLTPNYSGRPLGACRGCTPLLNEIGVSDVFKRFPIKK